MSFEKTVKLACKPKAAPPKAKYVDPLIAATYSNDGAVHDVLRALGGRLREPNSVVVFKALIVLHQMIRAGSTDNVLSYLSNNTGSAGDVLRLRNVTAQAWDGYTPPANLGYYAQYLDARIRGYKELKHDPVRVQAESNRMSNYEGSSGKARKLRQLTVEKGLLREVKQTQRMVDALVQCKLYEDHLEDECTVTALRMMVKDLLVLTQAVNEGVINVLEHYFEMSKVDATEALAVYKAFCKQSDKVVEYLGTARRLHQLLDVPVPNLKHAPVSLVAALEEYLHDPNFEQNRLEYKRNMAVADGAPAPPSSSSTTSAPTPAAKAGTSATAKPVDPPRAAEPPAQAPAAQSQVSRSIQDFFQSIESDNASIQPQHTGFATSPQAMWSNQSPVANPFRQSMMFPQGGFQQPQFTGQPFGQPFGTQPFGQQAGGPAMFATHTGMNQPSFMQPQATGWPAQQGITASPWSAQPQGPQIASAGAATYPSGGSSDGLQPLQQQVTGNPFRQSMMFPQMTGAAPFSTASSPPPRATASSPFDTKPLSAQPTGSKNPFAPPPGTETKKAPTGPSLFELSMQRAMGQSAPTPAAPATSPQQANQPQSNSFMSDLASAFSVGPTSASSGAQPGGGSHLPDFANLQIGSPSNGTTAQNGFMQPQATGYAGSSVKPFQPSAAFLQPQSPGQIDGNQLGNGTSSFLQPQPTGFAGSAVKPFKPSSTFGSSLVESLPGPAASPVNGNGPASPSALQPTQTGYNPFAFTGHAPGSGSGPGKPNVNSHSDFLQSLNAR